jgi:hypothetical protein
MLQAHTVYISEQLRLDTTYYNLVIRYFNLKKSPGYIFRPFYSAIFRPTQAIKLQNTEVYSMGSISTQRDGLY